MGSGIVQKIAQEGIEVVMIDMEDRFVERGMENIRVTLAEAVSRRIFTSDMIESIMERITGTTDLNCVKDADLVIEAIFEDFNVKRELFERLDPICDEKTILASNTSSFSISEMSDSLNRKDRFLGLHFFYHPAKNRLLEVIPGIKTSSQTIERGNLFSILIGKTGINVADAPGFAVNRFFVPWLNEATRLLEEGISIPTIDETAKKVFKIGMGPFLLMNVTGVPIAYHSTVSLGNKLGDFYGPSECLKQQFEKGEDWILEGVVDRSHEIIVEERLLGAVFTVAGHLVDEGVASMEDTDRGAKIGLRWSRGPFEMMNRYGLENSFQIVERFVKGHGLTTPKILNRQMKTGEGWNFSLVDLVIKNEIARIIINRPEAMNAINESVVRQLDEQFIKAEKTPGVKAIVLEGAGKAFVAGADIQYFLKKIDEGKINDIVNFTRYGHEVLGRIDNSDKLVIAKLDGLALGGGVELALAADTIVATDKGTMGLPETGIGIYPGLGGTQRTSRYIGKEFTKYLVLTGKTLDAGTALKIGLVEYVFSAGEVDEKIRVMVKRGGIRTKDNRGEIQLPPELEQIKGYFTEEYLEKMLTKDEGLDELGARIAKTIGYKAPIAIKLANKIIDEGSRVSLKEGLEMELQHLPVIFATKDAYEGLNSVIKRKRPVYTGD